MNCDVIRDLLPLYTDGLTSPQTTQLIEEHLQTCLECSAVLEQLRTPMESACPENTCGYMKALQKQLRRRRIRTVCICLFLPLLILFVWWLYMQTHFAVFSATVDSTNPVFILKKEPRAALSAEEIELAQALFAHPVIRESFPENGHVLLSPSLLEDILSESIPENSHISDITLLDDYIILTYQHNGTHFTLEYSDADHTGFVDLISKTVSTPDARGKTKYVYTATYHTATEETMYERYTTHRKWFAFGE